LEIFENCQPVYEELPGWRTDITGAKSFADLPENARAYVRRLEELAGCPIVMVSVGPRRDQTITLRNPFA
jgi:adenylosuccinate synthase